MKHFATLLAATFCLSTTAAFAGDDFPEPIISGNSEQETSLFAGLNWQFGSNGNGLTGRVGAIYTDTDSGDDVTGARLFLDFDLDGGGMPRLFVTGFTGDVDHVGELGGGFDFDDREFFGHLAVLMSYFEFGATYGFSGAGFGGYGGLHTFEFEEVAPNRFLITEPFPPEPFPPEPSPEPFPPLPFPTAAQ